MRLQYAQRVSAKIGEVRSGDAVFARLGERHALFVLLDGLGHGEPAYRVAERAVRVLDGLPTGTGATSAISALNTQLHGTRGAAATACSFRENGVEIAGVGNILCRAIGVRGVFMPTPGVLGFRSQLREATQLALAPGQGLILHSDGISHRFEPQDLRELSPDAACEHVLRHHRYQHDDASVLVIRTAHASANASANANAKRRLS